MLDSVQNCMEETTRTWTWPMAPFDHSSSISANEKHDGSEPSRSGESSSSSSAATSPRSSAPKPAFHHKREPSQIELFYDLFFVASIATVTISNEIVDVHSKYRECTRLHFYLLTAGPALKAILGFFSLLWFTWLQTILYDVRFSSDSVFHQAHKAISCTIMLAFVACGSIYDTSNIALTYAGLKYMSFVLMTSRLALFFQYGIVFGQSHGYQRTVVPFLLTMVTYLGTAAGFLGIALGVKHYPRCYLAWSVFCMVNDSIR